jgi:hypothetical protein
MLYSVIWLLTRVPKNDWKNSTEAENSSSLHEVPFQHKTFISDPNLFLNCMCYWELLRYNTTKSGNQSKRVYEKVVGKHKMNSYIVRKK